MENTATTELRLILQSPPFYFTEGMISEILARSNAIEKILQEKQEAIELESITLGKRKCPDTEVEEEIVYKVSKTHEDVVSYKENNSTVKQDQNLWIPKSGKKRRFGVCKGPLGLFTKKKGFPRKEFVRMSFIRKLQKAFRKFTNHQELYHQDNLVAKCFNRDRIELEKILLDMVPALEQRNRKGVFHSQKSYNDAYFAEKFSKGPIVNIVKLFMQSLMQNDQDYKCKFFKLQCCQGEHDELCEEKWDKLANYLVQEIVEAPDRGTHMLY